MKRRYFIIAALFLFNPIVSVFDIFPDVIGYLLIMKGLSEASYVFDNADETKHAFKTMTVISIFKIICLIILPFTDSTMALVFSFTFAIIEFIFGIGAYQKLFDTVSFICLRCDENASVRKSEKLKKFTTFFFVTRILCSTVPDFFALFLSDPQKAWMYRFRTLFFFLFTIVASVIGIIWLVRTVSFFKNALTDKVKEKIKADFTEEMKDRQGVFFSKDFILAISVISISMLFTIDFYFDGVEALSDIILAPILASAFIFLIRKNHIKPSNLEKVLFLTLAIHFVSSTLNTVFTARYNNNYLITSITKNSNALEMYIPVRIFTALEAISFFAITFLVLYLLNRYTVQRIKENPKFFSEYSVDGFLKEYSKITKKRNIFVLVLAGISSVSSIVYTFIIPYMEAYVVINSLLAIVFYMVFIYTLSYTSENIYKRILKYS